jgi:hypothetical protein
VDSSGAAYVTGFTASTNFLTQGAYQTDRPDAEVFVSRWSMPCNHHFPAIPPGIITLSSRS